MLLADFHIHSTWSDGRLAVPEIVDAFGRTGHDVIAITDHVVNEDSLLGKIAHSCRLSITKDNWDAYRAELESETRRAWDEYRMVVLPGVELTRNALTGKRSAHALALNLDRFVSADGPVEEMLTRAREAGAVTVACHPNEQSDWFANTYLPLESPQGGRASRRPLGARLPLGPLPAGLPRAPPVPRQQRLPRPARTSGPGRRSWSARRRRPRSWRRSESGLGLGVTRLLEPTPVAARIPSETQPHGPCTVIPGFVEPATA